MFRTGVRRAVAAVATAAAVAVPLGVVPTAGAGPAAPTQEACPQPYVPRYGESQQGGPGSDFTQVYPDAPVERPALDGTDLSYLERVRAEGVDTDGDGTADAITVEADELVITRGDGVIRLGTAGAGISTASTYPVGDLDGDGRDELYFLARPSGDTGDLEYILPGTTAPGTYESADVSILLPPGLRLPAGPQVPGPGDDVLAALAPTSSVTGAIISGTSIMAPGPGGTLAAFEPASEPFTGQPVAVLELPGRAAPTIVTFAQAGDHSEFLLYDEGTTTRYRTAGPSQLLDPNSSPFLQAYATGDDVVLVGGTGNRGGTTRFVWDEDDPCGEVIPLPIPGPGPGQNPPGTPGTPTPAAPVAGAADYTG